MAVQDFVALDVETANSDYSSICSIGLVHFRAGEVHRSLHILVNPQDKFSQANISIHGIRPEHVVGCPTMQDVIPIIGQNLKDSIIAHHSSFDRAAIRKAAAKYGLGELPCFWIDTLRVARQAWAGLGEHGGYGLKNLARRFSIEFEHHRADEDARAAGIVLMRAVAETGISLEDWVSFCAPDSKRYASKVSRDAVSEGPLSGELVVFTGSMEMSREQAAQMASLAGAEVRDSVTKKTTMLVVGDQDLSQLAGHDKSSKHRKAEELISIGFPIRVLTESDFKQLLN